MSIEDDRRIVRDFGPWTIHAEIYSKNADPERASPSSAFTTPDRASPPT
jgi:hypothetical protein